MTRMRPKPSKNPDWRIIKQSATHGKNYNKDYDDIYSNIHSLDYTKNYNERDSDKPVESHECIHNEVPQSVDNVKQTNQNTRQSRQKSRKWLEILRPAIKEARNLIPDLRSEKGKVTPISFRTYPEVDKLASAIKEKFPYFYLTKAEIHRRAHYVGIFVLSTMHEYFTQNPQILWLMEHEEVLESLEVVENIVQTMCNVLERFSVLQINKAQAVDLIEDLLFKVLKCEKNTHFLSDFDPKLAKKMAKVKNMVHAFLSQNEKVDEIFLKLVTPEELAKIKKRMKMQRYRDNLRIKKCIQKKLDNDKNSKNDKSKKKINVINNEYRY